MPGELTIVGIGLIGASFALAVRDAFDTISALDPDDAHVRYALEQGIVDRRVAQVPEAASAVLLACPSDRISGWIRALAGHRATVFDAGSVKGVILDELTDQLGRVPDNYVAAHPIAGGERSGPQAADPDLFRDRTVILTPGEHTSAARSELVAGWWRIAGAVVEEMDPARHDEIYARTSHLPHLLVFAYLLAVDGEELAHTGGGFRDFSRIGGSDPLMWSGIFDRNRSALLAVLDDFERDLAAFREAIEQGDLARCRELIAAARARRAALT